MHPLLYLAIGVLFIVGAVLAFTSMKTTPDNKVTTTPGSQRNTLTFNSNTGIDYSAANNIEKSFTFGTFTASVILTNMSFSFDVNNSVFTNASVNLVMKDSNNNEFYKQTIDNFIKSPMEFQINDINVPKDTKLMLIINGDSIKLFRPNVSFTYRLPNITLSPIETLQPTTMQPTMMPTMMPTMQPTIIKPSTTQNVVFKPVNNTSLSVNNNIQNFSMGTLPFKGIVKNITLTYNPSSTISSDSIISVQIFDPLSTIPLYKFQTDAVLLKNPNRFVLNEFTVKPGQTVSIQLNGSNIMLLNPELSINVETTSVPIVQPTTMYPMEPTTMYPTMEPTTLYPTMQPTTMYPMEPTTMMPTTMYPMEPTMMPTTMMPTTMYPMEPQITGLPN
jgi:hypothetical protein